MLQVACFLLHSVGTNIVEGYGRKRYKADY